MKLLKEIPTAFPWFASSTKALKQMNTAFVALHICQRAVQPVWPVGKSDTPDADASDSRCFRSASSSARNGVSKGSGALRLGGGTPRCQSRPCPASLLPMPDGTWLVRRKYPWVTDGGAVLPSAACSASCIPIAKQVRAAMSRDRLIEGWRTQRRRDDSIGTTTPVPV